MSLLLAVKTVGSGMALFALKAVARVATPSGVALPALAASRDGRGLNLELIIGSCLVAVAQTMNCRMYATML